MTESEVVELWEEYRKAKMYSNQWPLLEGYSKGKFPLLTTGNPEDKENGSTYWVTQYSIPGWFLIEIGYES